MPTILERFYRLCDECHVETHLDDIGYEDDELIICKGCMAE
jgi:hypothetical protein